MIAHIRDHAANLPARRLRTLVATETECCRWAAWAVETNAGATVLDVRSTGPGIAALHGMFRPAGQAAF